jgi:membrane fusion protein, multidrug efflux system
MNNILKTFSNLITFFFLTILIISCQNKIEEKTRVKNIAELDTIAVKTAKIEYNDIKLSKTYTGSLEGEEQAYIVAKISERIIDIRVQIGNYVEKGKVIVELDKVGSTSQYYQAEAGYLNSKKDLDRMRVLYDEGAISQQMFDGAQTAFNIAKANFDASKSLVELTSPINGIVTEINGEAGDLTTPGTRIVTIAKINRLKAVFNVGEQDIMSLMVNQPIEVFSELKPELVMNGKIIQISKSADIESRTFEINGLITNSSDKWFKPGMFCRVRIILKNQNSSLTVPSSSLIINGNDRGVFVVSNGKAYFRKLILGINDDIFTEILNGLKENEKVVTMGMNNLKDGIPVRIVE